VEFIGHPLLDIVKTTDPPGFIQRYHIQPQDKIIGLFPGSRRQEIDRLLPRLIKAAQKLLAQDADIRFFVPVTKVFARRLQRAFQGKGADRSVLIPFEERYDLMSLSQAALAISGTVTLELSIFEVPMVITYAVSPLTYWIAKHLLKIKLRYVGLPNIVANMQVVPEFVQHQALPEVMAAEIKSLLDDIPRRERMRSNLRTVKRKLGDAGAIDKAARSIYTFLRA
jgi:lipid-A-disaccharide synthase